MCFRQENPNEYYTTLIQTHPSYNSLMALAYEICEIHSSNNFNGNPLENVEEAFYTCQTDYIDGTLETLFGGTGWGSQIQFFCNHIVNDLIGAFIPSDTSGGSYQFYHSGLSLDWSNLCDNMMGEVHNHIDNLPHHHPHQNMCN